MLEKYPAHSIRFNMPKGNKIITLYDTTFHRCVCGYDIEATSSKLVEMKKRLHRLKCNEWKKDDVTHRNIGIQSMPPCQTQHSIKRNH